MRRNKSTQFPALSYRRARRGDVAAMSRLRLSVKENILTDPSRVTPQMYDDYLHRLGRGWVCCRGREVVGFSYASRADASIWALFVKPGCEGMGIGQRLMAFAENWLFALGHRAVTLYTGSGTRADRFYDKAGWMRGIPDMNNNVAYRKLAPAAARQGAGRQGGTGQ